VIVYLFTPYIKLQLGLPDDPSKKIARMNSNAHINV